MQESHKRAKATTTITKNDGWTIETNWNIIQRKIICRKDLSSKLYNIYIYLIQILHSTYYIMWNWKQQNGADWLGWKDRRYFLFIINGWQKYFGIIVVQNTHFKLYSFFFSFFFFFFCTRCLSKGKITKNTSFILKGEVKWRKILQKRRREEKKITLFFRL